MANNLMALLAGMMGGLGQAQKDREDKQYKDSLIQHIKTQAKLDEQKIQLAAQEGLLKQDQAQQVSGLINYAMGGPTPDMNLVPKKASLPVPGQPLPGGSVPGITEIVPPAQGAMPPQQKPGLISMLGKMLGAGQGQTPQPQAQPQPQVSSSNQKFNDLIQWAGQKYQVDPNLIASVITHESQFNPQATSPAGAQGLMQLMPETAQQYGISNAYDPTQNVIAGTQHLKYLLTKYQGNVPQAIAAYNAGEGRVDQGGQLPKETQIFVPKVMNTYQGLISPVSGKVTSGMMAMRDNGTRQHNAYDIGAPAGTQVVAPSTMTVTQVRPQMSNSPGGMVWGTDQQGNENRLLHITPAGVKVGDTVQAGQPIGTVYPMQGPHVHFSQVNAQGQPVDYLNQPQQMPQQGQPQQGPATAPNGRPMLSRRDALNLALQYSGLKGLGDEKVPPHIDTGDKILFVDPADPTKVLGAFPKSQEVIMQTGVDGQGRPYSIPMIKPRAEQLPGGYGTPIFTGPTAAEKGKQEGTQEQAKKDITGETPETAGKINLVNNALKRYAEANEMIITPDNKINWDIIRKGAVTGPKGAGIGDARQLYSKMYQTMDAALRLETGAQANPEEIQNKVREFWPSVLDNEETVRQKMKDLGQYINGLPGVMKSVGGATGEAQQQASETAQPKRLKYNPQTGRVE